MRFVLAIVSLAIAVGLAGYGFAQRTILSGPDSLTATSETRTDATVTVIDGETLNALDGRQDLTISGSETIFAAYGRTVDVLAWIGEASYNRLRFDAETSALVSITERGSEEVVPSPAGSDLWLREYTGQNELEMKVSLDEELSILVVSDGTQPAPSTVSISWPIDNRTPWAGPLIAGGVIMLVLALGFFLWAIVDERRTRGPRRKSIAAVKSPRMPKLPRQRSYRVTKPKAVTTTRGRRSSKRMTAVIPVVLIGSVALSGCSSELWPELGATGVSPSASPIATSEIVPVEEMQPPAATVRQIETIVRDAASVAEAADAALDAEALKARFAGPAHTLRAGNYATRAKDSAFAPLPPIPTGPVEVTLPQQSGDTWPRSVFAIVSPPIDESTDPPTENAPVALIMVQETPRDQYKVHYAVALESDAELPQLAPEGVGVPPLAPDTKFLSLPPAQLVTAYTDVLNLGAESASWELFDIERDDFIPEVGVEARAVRKAAIPATAAIEFSLAAGEAQTIALASNEAGALVTAYLTETETVTPVEEGATINPEGATKTLSGIAGSTKGFTATYGDQLLFYIPPVGSTDKIVLLGFSQGLISAQEIA